MTAERQWWRRAGAVLVDPREVFGALRDDSEDAAHARQEPVLVLAFLAGLAIALGTERTLFDDVGGLDYLVLAFVTGIAYGMILYWVAGTLLVWVVRGLGAAAPATRIRHVFAYSLAPTAVGLAGVLLYEPLLLGFAAWSLGLLVLGVRLACFPQ